MTGILFVVCMAAGQETSFERKLLATLPEGADALSVSFSPDGRSLDFLVLDRGERYAVVGGERVEGFDDVRWIVRSPDRRTYALIARIGEDSFVVGPEGKKGPYDDVGRVTFSPDGRLVYGAMKEGKWRMYGWKEQASFDSVGDPAFDSKGERLSYFAKSGDRWDVVVDEKVIAEGFDEVRPELVPPAFSPDGKRLAYVGKKEGRWGAVVDDRRFEGFDRVDDFQFSADGRRFGLIAEHGEKGLVVVDGEKQEEFDSVWALRFSPDGKTVAFGANAEGASFLVVGGKRGPPFEDAMPGGFAPDGRSFAYFVRHGKGESMVLRVDRGREFDVWHQVGPEFDRADECVFSRDGSRVAYTASRAGREFIVVGEEKSEEFDQVWPPVFDAGGKRVAFGARKGRELWWEVWTIETQADRVKRRLLELIDLAKAGDFRKAADYVVYRGDNKEREWKDLCNPDDREEARGVREICGRALAELGDGFEWGAFTTKHESEGEWCTWEVLTGKEKKRYYCFLLVKGRYAIGDID